MAAALNRKCDATLFVSDHADFSSLLNGAQATPAPKLGSGLRCTLTPTNPSDVQATPARQSLAVLLPSTLKGNDSVTGHSSTSTSSAAFAKLTLRAVVEFYLLSMAHVLVPRPVRKTTAQRHRPIRPPARFASARLARGGVPRPIGRYVLTDRPYRPCFQHRCRRPQVCSRGSPTSAGRSAGRRPLCNCSSTTARSSSAACLEAHLRPRLLIARVLSVRKMRSEGKVAATCATSHFSRAKILLQSVQGCQTRGGIGRCGSKNGSTFQPCTLGQGRVSKNVSITQQNDPHNDTTRATRTSV